MAEISTVRKSFSETVKEIKELEMQKKEVIPKIMEGEAETVEVINLEFSEALAELRRLNLIKRLNKKTV